MSKTDQPFKAEMEVKDKIGVLIKKAGGKHEQFLVRLTPLKLNGTSVSIFGRPTKHGTDRRLEVEQIVFRDRKDIEKIVEISVCRKAAPDLHEMLIRRLLAHPSVCIAPDRFTASL